MFMKKMSIGLAVGLSLAATSSAFAAETADIKVFGSITPTACDIALTEASVNVGTHNVANLNQSAVTELDTKTVGVTITCDAPAPFALSAVDLAAGSASAPSVSNFGLGKTDDGENIGYYQLRFDEATLTADGSTVEGLASPDKVSWNLAPTSSTGNAVAGPALLHSNSYLAFGAPSAGTVADIEVFSATLQISPFIAPLSGLTIKEDVPFEGTATLQINYL
jgi:type 1 fimbria pilin